MASKLTEISRSGALPVKSQVILYELWNLRMTKACHSAEKAHLNSKVVFAYIYSTSLSYVFLCINDFVQYKKINSDQIHTFYFTYRERALPSLSSWDHFLRHPYLEPGWCSGLRV